MSLHCMPVSCALSSCPKQEPPAMDTHTNDGRRTPDGANGRTSGGLARKLSGGVPKISGLLQRGKSDSFIVRGQSFGMNGKFQAQEGGLTRKRSGLFAAEEDENSNGSSYYEEAFISRTSSASHHGLSFAIAGPVQIPDIDYNLLSDLAEARRQAEMTLENDSPDKQRDHTTIGMPGEACDRCAPLPISLKFVDLRYKVVIKNRSWTSCKAHQFEKDILHGVTGYVVPGEVLALMGPSGSGKTSLLNLLSGRVQDNTQGTITYNDMPYTKSLKRRMGFVMQDDILYPHLTVKETLTYAALLRLPKGMSRKQKRERAVEVIHELGLERCQDTIIGGPFLRGISGGERKRVCVGNEILIDPSVIFLDEPTSGLDSTTALRTVQMLHQIAEGGRTVVTTIHQPSSRLFHMFDKLILLAEGHLIYFGKAADALGYFSSIGFSPLIAMNPADFLLDLASGNTTDVSIPTALEKKNLGVQENGVVSGTLTSTKEVRKYLFESYETSLEPIEKSRLLQLGSVASELREGISVKRQWSSSWWLQFSVLFIRGLRERRHEYLSWLRILQVIASAFIIGCLWWQSKLDTEMEVADQTGLLFFIATFWGFFPLFTAIFTFPQERAILAKERASDMYRLSAYFMARTLGDLPLDLFLPVIFLLIIYFMAHLRATASAFFLTLLTVFLSTITAQGAGIAIGAAMMDLKKASTLASVVLLTFMLTGGFFVQHIPPFISWIRYLSFTYQTFKLIIKVQYDANQKYDCTSTGCQSLASSPAIHNISLGGGGEEAWVLLVMVVGYRLLAYIALRRMKLGV